MESLDLKRTTEIIAGLAQETGEWVMQQAGMDAGTVKYDGTLVTEFDAAAELMIRRRLHEHFPGHTIFGEELGFEGPEDNPWRWYLDPIDGTSNFIFGIPIWGVSIGLTYEHRPVAGAFAMPPAGRLYWAWEGGGAYCNGRRLAVYDPPEMQHTDLVCISSPVVQHYELRFTQKLRCLGSAAEALASMAAGSFVALIHDNWRLHDMAAGLLMCTEAGALVSLDDGTPFESFAGVDAAEPAPTLIVAGPTLHREFVRSIRRRG